MAYDNLPETVVHTSVLLNGTMDKKSSVFKNSACTECTELHSRLSQERYDFVRKTKRFKAIEKMIAEAEAIHPKQPMVEQTTKD